MRACNLLMMQVLCWLLASACATAAEGSNGQSPHDAGPVLAYDICLCHQLQKAAMHRAHMTQVLCRPMPSARATAAEGSNGQRPDDIECGIAG